MLLTRQLIFFSCFHIYSLYAHMIGPVNHKKSRYLFLSFLSFPYHHNVRRHERFSIFDDLPAPRVVSYRRCLSLPAAAVLPEKGSKYNFCHFFNLPSSSSTPFHSPASWSVFLWKSARELWLTLLMAEPAVLVSAYIIIHLIICRYISLHICAGWWVICWLPLFTKPNALSDMLHCTAFIHIQRIKWRRRKYSWSSIDRLKHFKPQTKIYSTAGRRGIGKKEL